MIFSKFFSWGYIIHLKSRLWEFVDVAEILKVVWPVDKPNWLDLFFHPQVLTRTDKNDDLSR